MIDLWIGEVGKAINFTLQDDSGAAMTCTTATVVSMLYQDGAVGREITLTLVDPLVGRWDLNIASNMFTVSGRPECQLTLRVGGTTRYSSKFSEFIVHHPRSTT